MSETSSLNDQIRDAVSQINATLDGLDDGVMIAAVYQTVAQSVALAMQNAVAQQQQGYILRNALTAAAASAIVEGRKEDADSLLKMVESNVVSPSLSAEITNLLDTLKTVRDELHKFRQAPSEPSSPSDSESVPNAQSDA